ncbi:phage portal protein [Phenylobacterium sp.]|uniref:phage portal protein n=1 Tax=Phenylobacterium sp. TaxID=1871053 RepID=UPI00301E5B0A
MTQGSGPLIRAARAFSTAWNRLTRATSTAARRIVTGRSAAGVYVDADNALKNATVWACVQYLSRAVAQVPWRVMEEDPRSGRVPRPSHPVDWLLNRRPNAEMGAFVFRQTLMQWALRYGNGYAEIERDNRGAVFALWPIHPERVTPFRRDGGELAYRVSNERGGYVELGAMDMFHVRGMGDGAVGLSVIAFAAESIGWAQATELFGATYFGQGMNPSGIVETEKRLTPEGLGALREELKQLYRGPKGERTVILDAGMKFSRLSTQPNDSQFIETRQHQVEEICRWFGVPPHKVMHLLRATFSNIEHQSIEVVVDSITPWARVLEDEADYKLFGARNRQGLYTKLHLQALMRGDAKSRSEFYWRMFQMAGLSPNQICELEDMNGFGPEGDVRFVPVNMQTLDRATAPPTAPAAPIGHNGGPQFDENDQDPDEPEQEA